MKDIIEKTCQCDPHEISYKCCACHFKEPQLMKPEEKKVFKKVFGAIKASKEEVILQRIEQALTRQREEILKEVKEIYPKLILHKSNIFDKDWEEKELVKLKDVINKLKEL